MHICTAFLISERHLLTAAKCLREIFLRENVSFSEYSIILGYRFHKIKRVERHKSYNHKRPEKNTSYDIGCITV